MEDSSQIEKQYESLCEMLSKKGIGEIILFLLEAHKPLVNITNQALMVLLPVIKVFISKKFLDVFLSIFDSSKNYEKFIFILGEKLKVK